MTVRLAESAGIPVHGCFWFFLQMRKLATPLPHGQVWECRIREEYHWTSKLYTDLVTNRVSAKSLAVSPFYYYAWSVIIREAVRDG